MLLMVDFSPLTVQPECCSLQWAHFLHFETIRFAAPKRDSFDSVSDSQQFAQNLFFRPFDKNVPFMPQRSKRLEAAKLRRSRSS